MPFPCRAHAVPMPCRAAKGSKCVYPIWFTQCGRVCFTLPMPCHAHAAPMPCSDHAVFLKATAEHSLRKTACGLPARVRLIPATTRSSTKIVIRSIPILLTTIHTNDWRVVAAHYKKDDLLNCWTRSGARHGMCELTHGMAGERHGRGIGSACYVWIGLKSN
jgi:hypothetical protein